MTELMEDTPQPQDGAVPTGTEAVEMSAEQVEAQQPAVPEEATPAPTRLGAPVSEEPTWNPQPGQVVRVSQRITELTKKGEERERLQIFEGTVIARRHGSEPGATFTVRKEVKGGYGVERIFPLFAPTIAKVDVVKQYRVRRAKLHHLRHKLKKGKKLEEIEIQT